MRWSHRRRWWTRGFPLKSPCREQHCAWAHWGRFGVQPLSQIPRVDKAMVSEQMERTKSEKWNLSGLHIMSIISFYFQGQLYLFRYITGSRFLPAMCPHWSWSLTAYRCHASAHNLLLSRQFPRGFLGRGEFQLLLVKLDCYYSSCLIDLMHTFNLFLTILLKGTNNFDN